MCGYMKAGISQIVPPGCNPNTLPTHMLTNDQRRSCILIIAFVLTLTAIVIYKLAG
jgi:hypothetical protein